MPDAADRADLPAGSEPPGEPDRPDDGPDDADDPDGFDDRLREPAGYGLGAVLDEELLRTLLRNAVHGIEGSPRALDHLRRAIPARRRHRRQALAGAVAAVLLAGVAIPALLRATSAPRSAAAASQNVASSHTPAPGADGHTRAWPGSDGTFGRSSAAPGAGPSKQQPSVLPGGPSASTSSPSPSETAAVPDCSSAQLGQGTGQTGAPDGDGRVYGWFRVANVSGSACTVPGPGQIQAAAVGSADPDRIQVMDHSPGDAAPELPSVTADGPFVLEPGEDYEVDFAWVPAPDGPGGCPPPSTPPASPTPTPTPTDSSSPGDAGPGSAPDADSYQSDADAGAQPSPPPGSVALSHTPAAGAPVVSGPVIQDVCAGTVYTTPARPDATVASSPAA